MLRLFPPFFLLTRYSIVGSSMTSQVVVTRSFCEEEVALFLSLTRLPDWHQGSKVHSGPLALMNSYFCILCFILQRWSHKIYVNIPLIHTPSPRSSPVTQRPRTTHSTRAARPRRAALVGRAVATGGSTTTGVKPASAPQSQLLTPQPACRACLQPCTWRRSFGRLEQWPCMEAAPLLGVRQRADTWRVPRGQSISITMEGRTHTTSDFRRITTHQLRHHS